MIAGSFFPVGRWAKALHSAFTQHEKAAPYCVHVCCWNGWSLLSKCRACHSGVRLVDWLLNVPAKCKCISGADLLGQWNMLSHWCVLCCFALFCCCCCFFYWGFVLFLRGGGVGGGIWSWKKQLTSLRHNSVRFVCLLVCLFVCTSSHCWVMS